MLDNSKGISLIEVISALAIVMIVISSLTPFLITIYKQKQWLKQRHDAYEILTNVLEEGRVTNFTPLPTATIRKNEIEFLLHSKVVANETVEFCVSWIGQGGENYEECGYSKKLEQ